MVTGGTARPMAAVGPLLDSATDHAAFGRPRAVLRTPLRTSVGPAVSDAPPAPPAPAADRARHGERTPGHPRANAGSESVRRPPPPGRPGRVWGPDRNAGGPGPGGRPVVLPRPPLFPCGASPGGGAVRTPGCP